MRATLTIDNVGTSTANVAVMTMNINDIGSLVSTELIEEYKETDHNYVYFLTNKEGNIEYIGSTNDLVNRLSAHTKRGIEYEKVYFMECQHRESAYELEKYFIQEIQPRRNQKYITKQWGKV